MLKKLPKENMGTSNLGWLESRFHFSFAEYRNPNNMPKNVTCSKKCRSELNILLNHEWVICENCGTKLHRKKSRNTGKIFCNQKCSDNFLNKVNKDDAIKYHNQGLYDFQIAEIFNCSRSNITNVMNKYNKHNLPQEAQAIGSYAAEYNIKQPL